MPSLRAFLAIEISGEVQRRVSKLISDLASTPARVKWVDPENIHLTLKFLGDTDQRLIPDICSNVQAAVSGIGGQFHLQCAGVGAFPSVQRARTIWVGVEDPGTHLLGLHEALELALDDLGIKRERRRFHPHLTIGRVRDGRHLQSLGEAIRSQTDFDAGIFQVSGFTLFSSELQQAGAIYTPLARFPLQS